MTDPRAVESDWELLRRVADGEADAFTPVVERHQDRLVALCERLLMDREAARDVAQEVFLEAFERAAHLEPRGQLYTWLYRVAVNRCLNRLRRRKIVRFLPFATRQDERDEGVAEPVDGAPDPWEEMEARERWRTTQRAIAALPASQRVVLILARFEGLPQRQIAALLGISEGAVESRLFRAMQRLVAAKEGAGS